MSNFYQEKPVSQFFGLTTAQQLRDFDLFHDNRDTKLHNLSKYRDEDDELYEVSYSYNLLTDERPFLLNEKQKSRWKKKSEENGKRVLKSFLLLHYCLAITRK